MLTGRPVRNGRGHRRQGMNRAPFSAPAPEVRRAAPRLWQWHRVPSTVAFCQLLRIFRHLFAKTAKPVKTATG